MRTILVILLSIGLSGCETFKAHKKQWQETGLIAAKRTAIAAGAAVLQAAVSQFDKEKKGDYLQGLSEALWTQAPSVINAATVEEIARVWTPDKSHWEGLAEALAKDFETKQPRSKEEALAILHSYAEGLYLSTEVAP